jgi:hypothetical protein
MTFLEIRFLGLIFCSLALLIQTGPIFLFGYVLADIFEISKIWPILATFDEIAISR